MRWLRQTKPVSGSSYPIGQRLTGRALGVVLASVALLLAACSVPAEETQITTSRSASASPAMKEPEGNASLKRLRLITAEQYRNTLAYIFGPDMKPDARFAPLQRTDGLIAVGAAAGGVNEGQLEQYQRAASIVAAQVVSPERSRFLVNCTPASDTAADTTCATKFLTYSGQVLFRRPLPQTRIDEVVAVADEAANKLKDFYAGLGVALESLLMSPKTLYIQETTELDPEHPGQERLDAYSLASRLSFFLWNAAPDQAVLKAAASGEIQTEQGRARVVDMMLASPRLETGMRAFFDDMFYFEDFDNLSKDPTIYPAFNGATAQDAREQTLRTVIDNLISKEKDYRDLFTTRDTFMSPALAAIYGVPAVPSWQPYAFTSDSPRAGLLTQISFLAVNAHPGRGSATLRGKALREILLCQHVPLPPPDVDFSAVENPDPSHKTARQRLTAHQENPVCAGCHKITDPMGLALENFDGAGQYRDTENGAPIDPSGSLDGKDFTDVKGLVQAVRDHPALPACFVRRLYAYGSGGPLTPADQSTLDYVNARFAASGYRLPELLRVIALSSAFSSIRPGESAPVPAAKTAGAGQVRMIATSSK